jgi:hypothetical protein
MTSARYATLAAVIAVAAAGLVAASADAATKKRPTAAKKPPAPVCMARLSGRGEGTGVFGAGSQNARVAATANWEENAARTYGSRFRDSTKAQGFALDCKSGVMKATCVATGRPCRT